MPTALWLYHGLALLHRSRSALRHKTHAIRDRPGTTQSRREPVDFGFVPRGACRSRSRPFQGGHIGPEAGLQDLGDAGLTLLRGSRGPPGDKTNTIGYEPGTTHSRGGPAGVFYFSLISLLKSDRLTKYAPFTLLAGVQAEGVGCGV